MTCHEARELFSDRLDGQLSADAAARLDAHLAGCDDCRLEWARFERVVSLAQGMEPSHAPAGFVDRVLEAARPVPWPVRLVRQAFTPLRIKLPLEAAALLLVGGLAVMMFQRSPEMQRMARQETSERLAAPRSEPAPVAPSAPAPEPSIPQSSIAQAPPPSAAAPEPPAAAQPPATAQPPAAPSRPAAPRAPATAEPRVAQELRRDTADSARRESAAKSAAAPPPAATPPMAAAAPTAPLAARARPSTPDVSAWLTVADRTTALTALAEAVTRFGGRENARRADGRGEIVDVVIPRDAYEAFIREVSRLGGFAAERQSAELPPSVSISLRITE